MTGLQQLHHLENVRQSDFAYTDLDRSRRVIWSCHGSNDETSVNKWLINVPIINYRDEGCFPSESWTCRPKQKPISESEPEDSQTPCPPFLIKQQQDHNACRAVSPLPTPAHSALFAHSICCFSSFKLSGELSSFFNMVKYPLTPGKASLVANCMTSAPALADVRMVGSMKRRRGRIGLMTKVDM